MLKPERGRSGCSGIAVAGLFCLFCGLLASAAAAPQPSGAAAASSCALQLRGSGPHAAFSLSCTGAPLAAAAGRGWPRGPDGLPASAPGVAWQAAGCGQHSTRPPACLLTLCAGAHVALRARISGVALPELGGSIVCGVAGSRVTVDEAEVADVAGSVVAVTGPGSSLLVAGSHFANVSSCRGALVAEAAELQLVNTSFDGAAAARCPGGGGGCGGAFAARAASAVSVAGCRFRGCSAAAAGGAGYVESSALSITASDFQACAVRSPAPAPAAASGRQAAGAQEPHAARGGALALQQGSALTLTHSSFRDNFAGDALDVMSGRGGAAHLELGNGSTAAVISDCTFVGCAASSGGAVFVESAGNVSVVGCSFRHNNGSGLNKRAREGLPPGVEPQGCGGGALAFAGGSTGSLVLRGCAFAHNALAEDAFWLQFFGASGCERAAAFAVSGQAGAAASSDEKACGGGGLALFSGAVAELSRNSWRANSALFYGGDVAAAPRLAHLHIRSDSFQDSQAGASGGSVHLQDSPSAARLLHVRIADSSFVNASAICNGGAVYAGVGSRAQVERASFTGCTCGMWGGAAVFVSDGCIMLDCRGDSASEGRAALEMRDSSVSGGVAGYASAVMVVSTGDAVAAVSRHNNTFVHNVHLLHDLREYPLLYLPRTASLFAYGSGVNAPAAYTLDICLSDRNRAFNNFIATHSNQAIGLRASLKSPRLLSYLAATDDPLPVITRCPQDTICLSLHGSAPSDICVSANRYRFIGVVYGLFAASLLATGVAAGVRWRARHAAPGRRHWWEAPAAAVHALLVTPGGEVLLLLVRVGGIAFDAGTDVAFFLTLPKGHLLWYGFLTAMLLPLVLASLLLHVRLMVLSTSTGVAVPPFHCFFAASPRAGLAAALTVGLLYPWLSFMLPCDLPMLLANILSLRRLCTWLNAPRYADLHSLLACCTESMFSVVVCSGVYISGMTPRCPWFTSDTIFLLTVGSSLAHIAHWVWHIALAAAAGGLRDELRAIFWHTVVPPDAKAPPPPTWRDVLASGRDLARLLASWRGRRSGSQRVTPSVSLAPAMSSQASAALSMRLSESQAAVRAACADDAASTWSESSWASSCGKDASRHA